MLDREEFHTLQEALVAAWWVRKTLVGSQHARDIANANRPPLDAFDAIVRYASVPPEEAGTLLGEV